MKKQILLWLVIVVLSVSQVLSFGATRFISGGDVTITVNTDGTTGYIVRETIPSGVTVSNVGQSGNYNAGKGFVKWIFTDNSIKTLTYSTSGSGQINGVLTAGPTGAEADVSITGDSTIPKTATTCTETDNGLDLDKKGTLTLPNNPNTYNDYCTNSNGIGSVAESGYVYEYYCKADGSSDTKVQACPTGKSCKSGACVTTAATSAVCGNNQRETGEVCDGTDFGGQTCVSQGYKSGTLGCKPGCFVFDYSGCSQAPPVSLCKDSDGGSNIYNKRTVTVGTDVFTDTCSATADGLQKGNTGPYVYEYICGENDKEDSEVIACPSGTTCSDGACVTALPPDGADLTVQAVDAQEADLFKRIHDALEKNSGNVLKQVSSVAGVFQCYFDSGCDLATYQVK
ncbi:hypothetical protein HY495_01545 [Candidatus Woesearchaeota archaeon]|nr:hypothetical protein [Candidatus Woesearchaeota archaeon]